MQKLFMTLLSLIFISTTLPQIQGQENPFNSGEVYDSSMELYYQGKCEGAIQGFLKIIQSAPTSKLVPYSQYMIGLCYIKMGKDEEALQQLNLYIKTYPEGDRVRDAERRIHSLKEQRKDRVPPPPTFSKIANVLLPNFFLNGGRP
jgi:TolA-binding protein